MPFVDEYVLSAHPPLPLHPKVPRSWTLDTYSTVTQVFKTHAELCLNYEQSVILYTCMHHAVLLSLAPGTTLPFPPTPGSSSMPSLTWPSGYSTPVGRDWSSRKRWVWSGRERACNM